MFVPFPQRPLARLLGGGRQGLPGRNKFRISCETCKGKFASCAKFSLANFAAGAKLRIMRVILPSPHTPASIAAACGVSVATIYRAISGGPCGAPLAVLVHHATKGAVPCWVLRPDLWRKRQVPPVPLRPRVHRSASDLDLSA